MAPTFDIVATAPDRVKADLLAVPVFTGGLLGPGADTVDAALGGTLAAFMTEARLRGETGRDAVGADERSAGCQSGSARRDGRARHARHRRLRRAGAAVARRASKVVKVATTVLDAAPDSIDRGDAAQAFVEGVALGNYQFLTYKSDGKPSKLARVQLLGRANAKLRAGIARGARIAEGVAWARDLVNEPAAAKSPDAIAKLARTLARANGLSIKVLAGEQLERERLGGVLGVGKGSERPPRFVRLAYEPKGARATIAFVGKGVVFDSGGLSIKTAGGMETMKTDMSGGAAVIAAMSTLRDLDVKTRVIGFIPLVENMPSGDAMRPGDVLRMRNGKTVEVLNTDAEGRLILADALSLATRGEARRDHRSRDAHGCVRRRARREGRGTDGRRRVGRASSCRGRPRGRAGVASPVAR